jgi:hypothetical protein
MERFRQTVGSCCVAPNVKANIAYCVENFRLFSRVYGISAMAWRLISGFGITMASIKWPKANPKPIQLKPIMLSYAIIWLAWVATHAVSRVALFRSNAQFGYLSMLSTDANFTIEFTQIIMSTSLISLAHLAKHSPGGARNSQYSLHKPKSGSAGSKATLQFELMDE